MNERSLRDVIQEQLPSAQQLLCDLIHFPSTPGKESEAMIYLNGAFGKVGAQVEKIALSDSLRSDPDYSDPIPDIRYDGRFNLRVKRAGAGSGKTVILNTHVDVVPPSEEMASPWSPQVQNDIVAGRGACDAKGQVATIYLVLKTLEAMKAKLNGNVVAHLVVEEENGGNGTLAMVRRGEPADACIVLEPTDGRLYTSIRGAVWFRLKLTGKAGHSGQAGVTRSALLMARDAIGILEKYHADLLAKSRGLPLFDAFPNPMPITFGRVAAGNWPASAPSQAVIEGVLGLLPNKTKDLVCEEMRRALETGGDEFLAKNFQLSFMYRHDSSVLDPKHSLPQGLLRAAGTVGNRLEVSAMTASCDAWFYNNQIGVPTVVYGPGSLKVAHSKDEQIHVQEMASAAATLTAFLLDYCGEMK
jgi:acetylornithine deacetylase